MARSTRPAGRSYPRHDVGDLPSFRDLINTIDQQPAFRPDHPGPGDTSTSGDTAPSGDTSTSTAGSSDGPVGELDCAALAANGRSPSVDTDSAALLDAITGLERLVSFARAMQQRYIAALARPGAVLPVESLIDLAASKICLGREVPDAPAAAIAADPEWAGAIDQAAIKAAGCEISCALQIAPQTARGRVETAAWMVHQLPHTLAAQQHGLIDAYRASIIADRTTSLTTENRRAVEQTVLPYAARRTPSRLRALIDREVTRIDPDAAARRETQARHGRGTHVDPDLDGMARFTATIGAPDAQTVQGVLDTIAAAVRTAGLADGRGQSQLRADVFTALFHDIATTGSFTLTERDDTRETGSDTGYPTGDSDTVTDGGMSSAPVPPKPTSGRPPQRRQWTIPACINIYVNAETLAGYDDEPAELAGHGIITADMARAIAQSAGTIRTIRTTTNVRGAHDPGSGRSDDPCGHDPGGAHGDDPGGHDSGRRRGTDTRNRDTGLPGGGNPDGTGDDPGGHGPSTNRGSSTDMCNRSTGLPGGSGSGTGTPSSNDLPDAEPSHASDRNHSADVRPGTADTTGSRPASAGNHSSDSARSRACGTVLDAGRTIYTPPRRLADYVTTRDRTCRFPGCHQPARRCDIDHRTPYNDGGATCACNLDSLCRFHHLIKTFTPWKAIPTGDGSDTLTWTNPTGRQYAAEPAHPLLDTATAPCGAGRPDRAHRPGGTDRTSMHPRTPTDDPPPF